MKKIILWFLIFSLLSCNSSNDNYIKDMSLIYPNAVIFNIWENNDSLSYDANVDWWKIKEWFENKFKEFNIKRLEKFDENRMTMCWNNYWWTFGNDFIKFELYSCWLWNSIVSIHIIEWDFSYLFNNFEWYPFICNKNIELKKENIIFQDNYTTFDIVNNSNDIITDWYYNIEWRAYKWNIFWEIIFLDWDKTLKPNERKKIKIKYNIEKYWWNIEQIIITPTTDINHYLCKFKGVDLISD